MKSNKPNHLVWAMACLWSIGCSSGGGSNSSPLSTSPGEKGIHDLGAGDASHESGRPDLGQPDSGKVTHDDGGLAMCKPGGSTCQAFDECCSSTCANQVCTECGF